MTTFSNVQTYYLRISQNSVLELKLFLDFLNLNWFNFEIFNKILLILKERIPIKLMAEINFLKKKQKSNIDLYRATNFQMAYFFKLVSFCPSSFILRHHFSDNIYDIKQTNRTETFHFTQSEVIFQIPLTILLRH